MPITARTLRGLGEKADAMRDADLALVRYTAPSSGSDEYDILPLSDAQQGVTNGSLEIIEDVRTSAKLPTRSWMKVSFSVNSSTINTGNVPYDAAFWSESACDKFLWPYYEGMRIWDDDYLPKLKAAAANPAVAGMVHVGESITHFVKESATVGIVLTGVHSFAGKQILTLKEFEAFQTQQPGT